MPSLSRVIRSSTPSGSPVVRSAAFVLLVIVLLCAAGGVAQGVVGGKTVLITAAPWTVVIWEKSPYKGDYPYAACTGVIIGPRSVLTAGHCVMSGNSAKPLPDSSIGVEAGTSNFERLPAADHPQASAVAAMRVMPGYIATSKITSRNETQAAGHDLAVLRLARPFNLKGEGVRAAALPTAKTLQPSVAAELVIAGFGDEKLRGTRRFNGTLNEVVNSTVMPDCTTTRVLCVYASTNICLGDSGSGAVETGAYGRVPTVVGIASQVSNGCRPGSDYFVYLMDPAILRFIKTSS